MSRQFKPGQLRPGVLYDISASYALTASYVTNLSQDKITTGFITASVQQSASIFLITSASLDIFKIQDNGVVILATQSVDLTGSAPNGGMYFTSSSFFVGLD
jgi:hypothetical protein